MSAVEPITSKADFDAILSTGKLFFVDFWADWCKPCQHMSATLEDIAQNTEEDVGFYKVDIDALPELTKELDVKFKSLPTFHAYKDGRQIGTLVRNTYPGHLRIFVSKHLREL